MYVCTCKRISKYLLKKFCKYGGGNSKFGPKQISDKFVGNPENVGMRLNKKKR